MAGGGVRAELYKGRTTAYVILACIVAASGGLIFGYDIGITSSTDYFLNYCHYDGHVSTASISSLYLAGLVASFVASFVTKTYGRRISIICGGLWFLAGAIAAKSLPMRMHILGRIMLGIGVGFGNQSVPLYLSEMAPPKIRGALNITFQLAITIGILCANLIKISPWGWRVSLGLAGVPAIFMTIGGLCLPETPNSLIERGRYDEGHRLLTKIRGTEEVDAEYEDIKAASDLASTVKCPFRNIFARRSRPQLVMSIMIPFFQQLTGINAIMFSAPVLFRNTIHFGPDASLYSAVVTGAVNVLATLVSIATVDKCGRRPLFLEAGVQMFISQVVIAVILGAHKELDRVDGVNAVIVVIAICVYVSSFAWSWGPLGWLVPSEIFPLETRSAGQAITVSVNFFFAFIIAQAFKAMMCHFKNRIFIFFAVWVVIMSVFVYFFLPETKNVPIEQMMNMWKKHWFWRNIIPAQDPPGLPYRRFEMVSNGRQQ